MAANQIDAFMGAIRALESGGGDPRGDYSARNRNSGAYGAYQIMPQYWDDWAREAGVAGARITDPKMQDIVARHRMLSLYRKYGRWDYVAGAWFAGEGGLNAHINGRKDPSDGNMRVSQYMNQINSNMRKLVGAGSPSVQRSAQAGMAGAASTPSITPSSPSPFPGNHSILPGDDAASLPDAPDPDPVNTSDLFEGMLTAISTSLSRGALAESEEGLGTVDPVGGEVTEQPTVQPSSNTATPADNALTNTLTNLIDAEARGVDLNREATSEPVIEGIGPDPFPQNTLDPGDGLTISMPQPNQPSPTPSPNEPEGNSAVLAIGEQYIGVPYKWGGTSPSGFDCSGLVQYVFRQVGINLPRTSAEQARVGQQVNSLSEAQPGDLVFWGGQNGRPNHIAIYAGNGKILEAPRTGLNVRYRDIGREPDAIRRVG